MSPNTDNVIVIFGELTDVISLFIIAARSIFLLFNVNANRVKENKLCS